MYTTPIATIDYIRKNFPDVKKLFMLGTPSMIGQFEKAGFVSCADDPDDVPDMLIVAFDTTLVYSRLCRATWWAKQGIPYMATNPDWVSISVMYMANTSIFFQNRFASEVHRGGFRQKTGQGDGQTGSYDA